MKKIIRIILTMVLFFSNIGSAFAGRISDGNILESENYLAICQYKNDGDDVGIYYSIENSSFVVRYYRGFQYAAEYKNDKPVYYNIAGLSSTNTVCPENGYVETSGLTVEVCFDSDGRYCSAALETTGRHFDGESEKVYDINDTVANTLSNFNYNYSISNVDELESFDIHDLEEEITGATDDYLIENLELRIVGSYTTTINRVYNFIKNTEAYNNYIVTKIEQASNSAIGIIDSRLESPDLTDEERARLTSLKAQIESDAETYVMNATTNTVIPIVTEESCVGYLGSVTNPNSPMYYLHSAFNLIKYGAIVLLLILTIVEYAKAVAVSEQDILKKATQKTVKRIIIAVIIFLLPTLIEFVLELVGISGYGVCDIDISM